MNDPRREGYLHQNGTAGLSIGSIRDVIPYVWFLSLLFDFSNCYAPNFYNSNALSIFCPFSKLGTLNRQYLYSFFQLFHKQHSLFSLLAAKRLLALWCRRSSYILGNMSLDEKITLLLSWYYFTENIIHCVSISALFDKFIFQSDKWLNGSALFIGC